MLWRAVSPSRAFLVVACAAFVAAAPVASACYYTSDGGFEATEKTQTKPVDLINGVYAPPDIRQARIENPKRVAKLEAEKAQRGNDLVFQDDYALALVKNGRFNEAEAIWKALLAQDPKRYITLCNYATA